MAKEDYVRLYRGINRVALPEADEPKRIGAGVEAPGYAGRVDTDFTGIHWTPDFHVAAEFAKEKGYNTGYDVDKSHDNGLVLEAMVHKRHIIDRNSEEGKHYAAKYDIWDEDDEENEHTVREGAPVIITKMHHVGKQFAGVHTYEKDMPWRGRAYI